MVVAGTSRNTDGNTRNIARLCAVTVPSALLIVAFLVLIKEDVSFSTADEKNDTTNTQNVRTKQASSLCEPGIVYRAAGVPSIKRRNDLGTLLQKKGFESGAEVGVQQGFYSQNLLNNWPSCNEFHLIDLWAQQTNYKDAANVDMNQQEVFFKTAQANVAEFKDKTTFHRMLSSEAAKLLPDKSLDFVYLDARHDYCGVTEDLNAYWPKVRPGGILAGHDFVTAAEVKAVTPNQDFSLCQDGTVNQSAVKGAVEDFAAQHGLVLSVTYNDPSHKIWQSWIVQKPTIAECVVGS